MNNNPQREFNLRQGLIHLNHAGVSPWPLRTAAAVKQFADENTLNSSYYYLDWLRTETELRERSRTLLNAPSADDIALLKNTSEALSTVAYGLQWNENDNIISTNQEFPSNRIVWESLSSRGVEFREADLYSSAAPEDALFALTDDNTRLISISSVQFSSGLRMDLSRIGSFCKEHNILFCVDAIQSLGAVSFDVQDIGADFVMADGHKWMLGPEGQAIFYCSREGRDMLSLNQYGWHMVENVGDFDRPDWSIAKTSRRFECGSPNMMGIYALNASLSLLLEYGMGNIEKNVLERTEYLMAKIASAPGLELITSSDKGRYAGIVTFRRTDTDNTALYNYLNKQEVLCALRGGAIRFSPHFYTPYEHLDRAIELVMKSI